MYDPRLEGRPQHPASFRQVMVNARGFKVLPKTESFAHKLLNMGYVASTLDRVSCKEGRKDAVLVHRHRGGVGDLITCIPGVENLVNIWDNVIVSVPFQYAFIFENIEHVRVTPHSVLFGENDKRILKRH